jgi:hypothetical protein
MVGARPAGLEFQSSSLIIIDTRIALLSRIKKKDIISSRILFLFLKYNLVLVVLLPNSITISNLASTDRVLGKRNSLSSYLRHPLVLLPLQMIHLLSRTSSNSLIHPNRTIYIVSLCLPYSATAAPALFPHSRQGVIMAVALAKYFLSLMVESTRDINSSNSHTIITGCLLPVIRTNPQTTQY